MPPGPQSRYRFTEAYADPVDGRLSLSEREPFGFRELRDTTIHLSREGDSWWTLAGHYYEAFVTADLAFDPSQLWWILADFQPEPVIDPTVVIPVGTALYIPSLRAVHELIFNDRRRLEEPAE